MIIAIDGPAASGKGTLAKRLARAFSLPHLDTGLLYRATAHILLDAGRSLDDKAAAVEAARSLDPRTFDVARLRTKPMGEAASVIAADPDVREALIDLQRSFARRLEGAVLDGRDIGTVICPDADAKVFVVATLEARARRRLLELEGRGEIADEAAVLADIERRDARDRNRASAPLKPAEDAVVLDTTTLDLEAAYRAAMRIVTARLAISPAEPKPAT